MSNLVEKIHGIYAITPDKPLNFEQIEKKHILHVDIIKQL